MRHRAIDDDNAEQYQQAGLLLDATASQPEGYAVKLRMLVTWYSATLNNLGFSFVSQNHA